MMKNLIYKEDKDKIGVLTINSGSGNPLTPDLLKELDVITEELEKKPPKALIIHGGEGKIFSGGFSLPHIFDWKRNQLVDFFGTFTRALTRIISLKCPTICAINGHAVAAGIILSLGTDLRVVKQGKTMLGFPEVDIGVGVPYQTQLLFAYRSNYQAALRYTMTGELFNPDQALSINYADYLAENEKVKAMEVAQFLLSKPGTGPSVTKEYFSKKIAREFEEAGKESGEIFLDSWFTPEAQKAIKTQAENLSKKP